MRYIISISAIVVSALLFASDHDAKALAKPVRDFHVRRIPIADTTGRSIPQLLSNESIGMECAVTLTVPPNQTTQINVGGNDVDGTSKYVSLCSTGCMYTILPMDAAASQIFLRLNSGSSSSTYVFALLGGGC